jgi:hypothetical protein
MPDLIGTWDARGVRASALGQVQHEQVVEQFRNQACERVKLDGPLQDIWVAFASSKDMLVMFDWQLDENPAVLIGAKAFRCSEAFLRSIHPDGFVLMDKPLTVAVVVDFQEHSFEAEQLRFAPDRPKR